MDEKSYKEKSSTNDEWGSKRIDFLQKNEMKNFFLVKTNILLTTIKQVWHFTLGESLMGDEYNWDSFKDASTKRDHKR